MVPLLLRSAGNLNDLQQKNLVSVQPVSHSSYVSGIVCAEMTVYCLMSVLGFLAISAAL